MTKAEKAYLLSQVRQAYRGFSFYRDFPGSKEEDRREASAVLNEVRGIALHLLRDGNAVAKAEAEGEKEAHTDIFTLSIGIPS